MTDKRSELSFQNKIIDSYKCLGGHARKWSSEWQKGPPDLICSLQSTGLHLVEVKHRPEFGVSKMELPNPMEPKQKDEAKKYSDAGGLVLLGIVGGSSKALGSHLMYFPWDVENCVINEALWTLGAYKPGDGFDVERIFWSGGHG